MDSRALRSSAATTRVILAVAAALSLIFTSAALARPVSADDHGDGASLNIRAVNEQNERLAGAVFTVEGREGTFTTGDNGQFCILGFPNDVEVTVTQTEAPEGYDLPDPASQLVEVDDDGDCDSPDAVFVNPRAGEGPGQGGQGTVKIMKHVCPDEVQSVEQFNALGGFLEKVLACPVITLPGDSGPDGALDADDDFFDQFVAGGTIDFNFTVAAGNGSWGLGDATFQPAQLCETDLGADANGDGTISPDVCLEVSHYMVGGVAQGNVTVTESTPPSGFRFGALEFTPGSGDDAALVGVDNAAGVINLDTSGDADVMLHVYNFANLEGTEGGQGGPKPREGTQGGGGLPDTAVPTTGTVPAALVALVFLTALGAGSLQVAWSRKRMR